MKKIIGILITLSPLLGSSFALAEATINFNVNPAPVTPEGQQVVTLLGCDNVARNELINTNVSWGEDNQVLSGIPYESGFYDSQKEYGSTKYYLASPPIPGQVENGQTTNIGLLAPNQFTFKGERPAQVVNLDYQILRPTYLQFVKVNYDQAVESCPEPKINLIPINTDCPNFPWHNGSLGAAGIGFLEDKDTHRRVFIPTFDAAGENPLQCAVTILDDIMLNHRVFFETTSGPKKSVSLTDAYLGHIELQLVCHEREPDDIPPGCTPPEPLPQPPEPKGMPQILILENG